MATRNNSRTRKTNSLPAWLAHTDPRVAKVAAHAYALVQAGNDAGVSVPDMVRAKYPNLPYDGSNGQKAIGRNVRGVLRTVGSGAHAQGAGTYRTLAAVQADKTGKPASPATLLLAAMQARHARLQANAAPAPAGK